MLGYEIIQEIIYKELSNVVPKYRRIIYYCVDE